MTSTRMHWVSGHRAGAGRGTVPVQEAQAGSLLTESRGVSGPSGCHSSTAPAPTPPAPNPRAPTFSRGAWSPRHSPYWSFRPVHAPRIAEFSQLLGQASPPAHTAVRQPHPGGPPAPFQAPGPNINRLGHSSRKWSLSWCPGTGSSPMQSGTRDHLASTPAPGGARSPRVLLAVPPLRALVQGRQVTCLPL